MSAGRAVVLRGDARRLPLPDGTADLICTSPPYFGLRSYTDAGEHYPGQIGSEATPKEWLAALLDCTREWVRVLKPSGSIFVNLGDKYSGGQGPKNGKPEALASDKHGHGGGQKWPTQAARPSIPGYRDKSLLGLPWRYALACTDDLGLILRRDIIWAKPNGLPESVTDRCRTAHEYVFHLVKQPRYYAAVDEIREPHTGPEFKRRAGINSGDWEPDTQAWHSGGRGFVMRDRTYNPLGKLPGSVWTIPSAPLVIPEWLGVDHFAAYPVELPRRIILGWSPPGICTECGEGRRPVADKRVSSTQRTTESRSSLTRGSAAVRGVDRKALEVIPRGHEVTITGYACACTLEGSPPPPTRAAVVVDPFGGTGTTALAAAAYGRIGITLDLSADYCRIARWRTRDPAERSRVIGAPKPPPVADGQGELFDPIEAL